jgi:hypothetical protein
MLLSEPRAVFCRDTSMTTTTAGAMVRQTPNLREKKCKKDSMSTVFENMAPHGDSDWLKDVVAHVISDQLTVTQSTSHSRFFLLPPIGASRVQRDKLMPQTCESVTVKRFAHHFRKLQRQDS